MVGWLSEPAGASEVDAGIAVQFRDGLIWVEVTVEGREEPAQFLLDSGASVSVVDLRMARGLGSAMGRKVRVQSALGEVQGHWPVRIQARVATFRLPAEHLAMDLTKLSQACDRRVDGLIGADFFCGRVLEVDYVRSRLRIREGGECGEERSIPMAMGGSALSVVARVNGGNAERFRVDTGCVSALEWVNRRAQAERGASRRAVAFGERKVSQTLTRLRLGTVERDTVPTGLHRRPMFEGESGLIGNGFLAQFGVVVFDGRAGRLILGSGGENRRDMAGL